MYLEHTLDRSARQIWMEKSSLRSLHHQMSRINRIIVIINHQLVVNMPYLPVVVAGEGLVEVHELRGARAVQRLAAPLQHVAAALRHYV